LPFVNVNGDPNLEYLSDGIAESIIYSLSELQGLKVKSRSSVYRYKVRDAQAGFQDMQAIGRDLGVPAVLTGRLTVRGDAVLISIELVDVRENNLLWGQQYDRKLSDINAVQQQIARDVSEKLRLKSRPGEQQPAVKSYTDNAEAYRAYLKGRFFWNKRTPDGVRSGIKYFEDAIAIDPNYALPYSGLADSYDVLAAYGVLPPADCAPKARAAAVRALEIDERLAEAHNSLGYVRGAYDWDWKGAEQEGRRALELNPDYTTGHQYYGLFLQAMGRFDDAFAELRRAQELDPTSPATAAYLGRAYYYSRHYDQAIAQFHTALDLSSTFPAHGDAGEALEQKGLYGEAIKEYVAAIAGSGNRDLAAAVEQAYSASGYKSALRTWAEGLKEESKRRYIPPYPIALIYARLGETDQSFEWLERAYEQRASVLPFLRVQPIFDSIRSDPRFDDLVRRLHFP
jgi:TolB-like protein